MAKPKIPANLDQAGTALWRSVIGKYELRADELVTLEAACRASDRIVAMEEQRDGKVTSTGSMGQVVVHPLIAEIRAHESQVSALLKGLKLPDDPAHGAGAGAAPNPARSAANSRWAAAHGAGA